MSTPDILAQIRKLQNEKVSLPLKVIYPSQINDGIIETAKIADLAVETAKIKDLNVETVKIQNNAVTIPVNAFTTGDIAVPDSVETTIQSAAVTSTGASIFIAVSFGGAVGGGGTTYRQRLYRDTTQIYESTGASSSALGNFNFLDTPGSGDFTYYFKIYIEDDSGTMRNRFLFLLETKK